MYQPQHLISWILIGLVAGAMAGTVVRGRGFGCLGDIIVGIGGALVGGVVMRNLVPNDRVGFIGSIFVAFLGAVLLTYLLRIIVPGSGRSGGPASAVLAPVRASAIGVRFLACGPGGCLLTLAIAIAAVIGLTELTNQLLPR